MMSICNVIDSIKLPNTCCSCLGENCIFLASLMSDLAIGTDLINKINTSNLCHFQREALTASMSSTVMSPLYATRSAMFPTDAALTEQVTLWQSPPTFSGHVVGGRNEPLRCETIEMGSFVTPAQPSPLLTYLIKSHTPEWREALLYFNTKAGLLLGLEKDNICKLPGTNLMICKIIKAFKDSCSDDYCVQGDTGKIINLLVSINSTGILQFYAQKNLQWVIWLVAEVTNLWNQKDKSSVPISTSS